MRDDSARWDPPAPLGYSAPGLTITKASSLRQHLVSGVGVQKRFEDVRIGWPDIAKAGPLALSLRRDRVLVIGDVDLDPGFHPAEALAVTDVSDAFAVMDLAGAAAFEHLRRGAELRLDRPSNSVMRLCFGIEVMLYRFADPARFRVHVPRAFAAAFRGHVTAAAGA
ncbi:MAG: hypothetical protein AAGE76_12490 [Pseudomonadota bacterium]